MLAVVLISNANIGIAVESNKLRVPSVVEFACSRSGRERDSLSYNA